MYPGQPMWLPWILYNMGISGIGGQELSKDFKGNSLTLIFPVLEAPPLTAPPRIRCRGPPVCGFLTTQAIRSIARSTASTRGPRGSAVEEPFIRKQKPAQRETNNSRDGESFVSLFIVFRGLFDAVHREQYGTALTPGGRWLRPLRMNGITSNSGHTKVLRNTAVRGSA